MDVLSEGRHLYIHMFESNASMLSRVIFYLKSVHFLFLFSIALIDECIFKVSVICDSWAGFCRRLTSTNQNSERKCVEIESVRMDHTFPGYDKQTTNQYQVGL